MLFRQSPGTAPCDADIDDARLRPAREIGTETAAAPSRT